MKRISAETAIFLTILLPSKSTLIKFIYSEKATKFCEVSTLLLSLFTEDKSKVDISQNFVAFSEYTNFTLTFSFYIYFAFIKQIKKWSGKCTQLLILTQKKSFHLEQEKKQKKGFGFYACKICKTEPTTIALTTITIIYHHTASRKKG